MDKKKNKNERIGDGTDAFKNQKEMLEEILRDIPDILPLRPTEAEMKIPDDLEKIDWKGRRGFNNGDT